MSDHTTRFCGYNLASDEDYEKMLEDAWKNDANNGLMVQVKAAQMAAVAVQAVVNKMASDQNADVRNSCALEAAAIHLGMMIAGTVPPSKTEETIESCLVIIRAAIKPCREDFMEFVANQQTKH